MGPSSEERLLAIIETQNRISATALDLDAVMGLVVERARTLVNASAGVVELLDGPEMVYTAVCGTAEGFAGLRLQAGSSLSGSCVALNEVLYCEDAARDARVDREACARVGAISMVCVPLEHDGRVVGVLKVYDPRRRAFTPEDMQTLGMLSGLIAAHMTHATAFQEQQYVSRHDALTGLLNRRGFDEHLGAEAARSRRYGGGLALCAFDLDGFKAVNDVHGHTAGDEVLRTVARHMGDLRGEDAAFRLGGDEFAILLVRSADEGAELVGERIAQAVAKDPQGRGVTVSYGIATLRDNDPARMVREADEKLYAQKRIQGVETGAAIKHLQRPRPLHPTRRDLTSL
jgi:diguanylate cyclase (GGDEF)-like protein